MTNQECMERHQKDLQELLAKRQGILFDLYDIDCQVDKVRGFIRQIGEEDSDEL